jgi:hypothetical protein
LSADTAGVLNGNLDQFVAATLARRAFGAGPSHVEDVEWRGASAFASEMIFVGLIVSFVTPPIHGGENKGGRPWPTDSAYSPYIPDADGAAPL